MYDSNRCSGSRYSFYRNTTHGCFDNPLAGFEGTQAFRLSQKKDNNSWYEDRGFNSWGFLLLLGAFFNVRHMGGFPISSFTAVN